MTLVLTSQSAFSTQAEPHSLPSMRWSPMTSTIDLPNNSALGLPTHTYASSASSSNAASSTPVGLRKATGGLKKRASRAGTRSVSTLSAAQLERKRANDREAQRAIRQRTKDHIDGLEAQLNDVKQTLDAREKLLTASHHRNRELEEENALLRMRLSEADLPTGLPPKYNRSHEVHHMSAPPSAVSEASGSISQRSNSNATAVNSFAMTNGNVPNQPNGWPQQHTGTFVQPSNGLVLATNEADAARNVTGWRARESPSTGHAAIPPGIHPPQVLPFTPTNGERPTWTSVSQQYEFGSSAAQNAAFQQQQSQHAQPDQHYTPQQPQTAFHPPLLPPQHDFQNMPVNIYQYQQDGFSQQQFPGAQQPSQTQLQQSPSTSTVYRGPGSEQQFNQSFHPPMQFRDDADFRTYTMPHFQAG